MSLIFFQGQEQQYSEEFGEGQPSGQPICDTSQQNLKDRREQIKSTTAGSVSKAKIRKRGSRQSQALSEQQSQRRERNKEAAKRSRARNKQRFDRLEILEVQLQQQLKEKKQELAEAKMQLEKYLSKNTLVINLLMQSNSLNIGKQMAYGRIEELINENEEVDEDELNLLLDTLKLKVGAMCKERQNTINYYFKQWIHLCYPALHRFLLWTATEGKHDFGQEPVEWAKTIKSNMMLTEEQKNRLFAQKSFLCSSKSEIDNYVAEIHHAKTELESEGAKLEKILEDLRHVVSPQQCAQICLFCEKNKFKREMHLWSEKHLSSWEMEEPPAIKKLKQ